MSLNFKHCMLKAFKRQKSVTNFCWTNYISNRVLEPSAVICMVHKFSLGAALWETSKIFLGIPLKIRVALRWLMKSLQYRSPNMVSDKRLKPLWRFVMQFELRPKIWKRRVMTLEIQLLVYLITACLLTSQWYPNRLYSCASSLK
jgi:hypothetical protein